VKKPHPWDIFTYLAIRRLGMSHDLCRDCTWIEDGAGQDAIYEVTLVFRGCERPRRLSICRQHIAYWRKLLRIHQRSHPHQSTLFS
jgi:hypothetical protein